jgi:hypothetical protein
MTLKSSFLLIASFSLAQATQDSFPLLDDQDEEVSLAGTTVITQVENVVPEIDFKKEQTLTTQMLRAFRDAVRLVELPQFNLDTLTVKKIEAYKQFADPRQEEIGFFPPIYRHVFAALNRAVLPSQEKMKRPKCSRSLETLFSTFIENGNAQAVGLFEEFTRSKQPLAPVPSQEEKDSYQFRTVKLENFPTPQDFSTPLLNSKPTPTLLQTAAHFTKSLWNRVTSWF